MMKKIADALGVSTLKPSPSFPVHGSSSSKIQVSQQLSEKSIEKQLKEDEPIFHDLGYDTEEEQINSSRLNSKRISRKKYLIKWKNGTVYEGQMLGKLMHGKGKICYPNGDYYQGQFFQNKFHGFGGYYHNYQLQQNRSYYQGEWVNDEKSGQGKQVTRGIVYSGSFCKNVKQGYGYIEWPSGAYYEGNFEADEIMGDGKMVTDSGTLLRGKWYRGKLEGPGMEIKKVEDGQKIENRIYEGPFLGGKKNGQGCLKIDRKMKGQERGVVQIQIYGKWIDGKLQGRITVLENGNFKSAKAMDDEVIFISDCEYQQLPETE